MAAIRFRRNKRVRRPRRAEASLNLRPSWRQPKMAISQKMARRLGAEFDLPYKVFLMGVAGFSGRSLQLRVPPADPQAYGDPRNGEGGQRSRSRSHLRRASKQKASDTHHPKQHGNVKSQHPPAQVVRHMLLQQGIRRRVLHDI